MECIFLNAAGTTLFVRDDMESGHWVQEQMNVTADFPFDAGKVIQIGQRIAFRDPATDTLEVFEIINVVNQEPDHFQQITAEHICIAELSDDHINKTEITDKTAAQALTTALTGTLWSVGNNSASGTQSADLSRGSVWNAVSTIQQNWNVYITPRVTISSAGAITGRYLDIAPAQGTWRGLRLSVRKNLVDPAVTYDDSEVYTALYGYGGSVDVAQTGQDDKTEELTFKDEVWTATSAHPAKPSGQTYLEWPEKTAIYGRNGRPRYGYYQNANIKDAAVLLQKTWESLQKSCEPIISITGTCVDFYRFGYKDQPIRLHDMAIVEIEETGELLYRQVICNDVDLVDPTGTRPEIGDYIPNIVYINRDTNTKASGGGGGGGGRGSMTNLEDEDLKWYTAFIKNRDQIGMVIRKKNGIDYIDAARIALAINEWDETTSAYINADHVNISATSTAHLLAGSIVYDENGNLVLKESTGGGILVEHNNQGTTATFGVWDRGNLTGGVMVEQINGQTGQTITRVLGSMIVIGNDQSIDADYRGKTLDGTLTAITTDFTSVNTLLAQKIEASDINATTINAALSNATLQGVGTLSVKNSIGCTGPISGTEIWSGGNQLKLIDASVSQDGKTLTITRVSGGAINFNKGDEEAAYNQGWNDCIDEALNNGYSCLTGYSSWNSGSSSTLYYYNTGTLGYDVATGSARVWRYGGSTHTYYSLPDKKT